MTQRKHITTSIRCEGCGREFGIIQQAHIDCCNGLAQLGIKTRSEYKMRFGSTMSKATVNVSVANIQAFNNSMSTEERVQHARRGHLKAVEKHPDIYRQGGIKGSAGLWAKDGQKDRHMKRLVNLNSKGFMAQNPNKLEQKFWDMIGADRIDFASFKFWKTIHTDRGHVNMTPDFRIPGTMKVIEVYGNYWHRNDDPQVRIDMWRSVGCECLVIWEFEINESPEIVKSKVEAFISRNLHECGTPAVNQAGW